MRVTCEGILKQPGEEFAALQLQLVQSNILHFCCRVNTQLAGSAEWNFMSLAVCYLSALFVLGYNEGFFGKTQQLMLYDYLVISSALNPFAQL